MVGVATAFEELRSRLTVQPRARAVNLGFDDLGFDVVPAFARPGGGLLIVDARGREWIPTDPGRHAELMEAADGRCGRRLRPLIKTFAPFPDPLRLGPPIDAYLTMERRLQLALELEAARRTRSEPWSWRTRAAMPRRWRSGARCSVRHSRARLASVEGPP